MINMTCEQCSFNPCWFMITSGYSNQSIHIAYLSNLLWIVMTSVLWIVTCRSKAWMAFCRSVETVTSVRENQHGAQKGNDGWVIPWFELGNHLQMEGPRCVNCMQLQFQAYRRALNVVQLHGPSCCAEAGILGGRLPTSTGRS